MIRPSDAMMAELPDVVSVYIQDLEYHISLADRAYYKLKGVLCNPEGYVSIDGSDGDKEEIQKAFALLEGRSS